jgi:proline dehydrogenase
VQAIEDSKVNNYALGVKLVRGAYHPHEIAAHRNSLSSPSLSISPDFEPPVWSTKDATDDCFNKCERVLLAAVKHDIQDVGRRRSRGESAQPRIGVFFGTHNWKSCQLVLDELVASGLACESKVANDTMEEGEAVVVLPDEVTERVTVGQLYGQFLVWG